MGVGRAVSRLPSKISKSRLFILVVICIFRKHCSSSSKRARHPINSLSRTTVNALRVQDARTYSDMLTNRCSSERVYPRHRKQTTNYQGRGEAGYVRAFGLVNTHDFI